MPRVLGKDAGITIATNSRKYKEATASEHIQEAGNAIKDLFDKKRQKRRMEAMSSLDSKHCSQKAWQRINLHTGRTRKKIRCTIDPSAITKQYRSKRLLSPSKPDIDQAVFMSESGPW